MSLLSVRGRGTGVVLGETADEFSDDVRRMLLGSASVELEASFLSVSIGKCI